MTRAFTDDMNTLGQHYVGELLSEQTPIRESVSLDMFGPKMIDTPDGKIPWIPPEFRTPSSDSNYVGKVGLSEGPVPIEIDLDEVEIQTDGKFSRKAIISRHADEVMSELETAEGLVGYLGSVVKGFNNVEVEAEVANVLQDPTKNATINAQNAWTDQSSAKVFEDFENANDTVMSYGENPDTCVLGLDFVRYAVRTAGIKSAADRSFDATGDAIAHQSFAEMLRRRFGYENVLFDNSVWRNENNKQATPKINRVFDGTAWVGSSEHLIVREKESMSEADSGYNSDTQNYWTLQHRLVDIYRGAIDSGVIIRNIE